MCEGGCGVGVLVGVLVGVGVRVGVRPRARVAISCARMQPKAGLIHMLHSVLCGSYAVATQHAMQHLSVRV